MHTVGKVQIGVMHLIDLKLEITIQQMDRMIDLIANCIYNLINTYQLDHLVGKMAAMTLCHVCAT